jgi:poly(glycerol-phosphate) alpha-glucosyltransferase
MGARGRQLVVEKFSWPKIGAQMHDVCKWILGHALQPACVLTENSNNQTSDKKSNEIAFA